MSLIVSQLGYNVGDEDKEMHASVCFVYKCRIASIIEHSTLHFLDISGPAHVVAVTWRKWKGSYSFLEAGKNLNDPPQLRALLLHLADEAVQDFYESLHLTFAVGEHVYKPFERHVFRQIARQHDETVA